jgi:hypothetical protein
MAERETAAGGFFIRVRAKANESCRQSFVGGVIVGSVLFHGWAMAASGSVHAGSFYKKSEKSQSRIDRLYIHIDIYCLCRAGVKTVWSCILISLYS